LVSVTDSYARILGFLDRTCCINPLHNTHDKTSDYNTNYVSEFNISFISAVGAWSVSPSACHIQCPARYIHFQTSRLILKEQRHQICTTVVLQTVPQRDRRDKGSRGSFNCGAGIPAVLIAISTNHTKIYSHSKIVAAITRQAGGLPVLHSSSNII
jgi:hypothetical protein